MKRDLLQKLSNKKVIKVASALALCLAIPTFIFAETSSTFSFARKTYSSSGYVRSKDILPGYPIRFVNVVTTVDLPKNTSITGYIYYTEKTTDSFSETKKVNFVLTSDLIGENTIKLPVKAQKLRVMFNLSSSNVDKTVTPKIDEVIVYAR